MSRVAWDRKTLDAYKAMKKYRKAFMRYEKASPSAEGARQSFDFAKEQLQSSLRDSVVEGHINSVMNSRPDNPEKVTVLEEEQEIEINFSHYFGLKKRQTRKIFQAEAPPQTDDLKMENSGDLAKEIEMIHQNLINKVEETRKIAGRIPKKKRKKQIALGVTSLIFGSGCVIANAYYLPELPNTDISYSVALTAFLQSITWIMGEAVN